MKTVIMCGDVLVNHHSRAYNGWRNPFGDAMPVVGDILTIGGFPYKIDDVEQEVKYKSYTVISREFKAVEYYNNSFDKQELILNVIPVTDLKAAEF